MASDYNEFLSSKIPVAEPAGFDIEQGELNSLLMPFQKKIDQWAIKRGRAAVFADCGLGKTFLQLEWSHQIIKRMGGSALIFAPLAVARQTIEEGEKFGISVNLCTSMADVKPGINITNYDKMHHFRPDFRCIVLDESSILKGFDGKTSTALKKFAEPIPYRLACTATPAPNDLVEICNHAEFLGIMREKEIKALFFKQGMGDKTVHEWTLRGHSKIHFYQWLASWSVAIRKPSDIGFDDTGYDLPELVINQVSVESDYKKQGLLFALEAQTLSERRDARRASLEDRVMAAAELVNNSDEQWLVWCDLNAESEALAAAIADACEVRGSDKPEHKEKSLIGFAHGSIRCLVSKPTIAGFGMNFQKCHNMIFVGLSDSYEQIYQATRRCWRFGQDQPVNVYIITSNQEGAVVKNIRRKEQQMSDMFDELVVHMRDFQMDRSMRDEMAYQEKTQSGKKWKLMLGDCIERIKDVDDESVGISIFSPPFPGMYAYSNSSRDIGNTRNIEEMLNHFEFLMPELLRVTMPGRSCLVHLTQEPVFKGKDGHVGLRDFRGETIRRMEANGWIYYGEVAIDKNPQLKAIRTKESTLQFKTLSSDSSKVRMAMADYLLQFIKPGDNPEPVKAGTHPRWNPNGGWITPQEWIRWARPIWYATDWAPDGDGIGETDVLNVKAAREKDDERHLAPLQLGVIERAIKLWSNPGDLVLDPFNGIGSTGYKALQLNRQYIGIELKESYYKQAIKNLKSVDYIEQQDLFSLMENTLELTGEPDEDEIESEDLVLAEDF